MPSLTESLAPRRPLPGFGEWTIPEDFAPLLVEHLLRERPATVLELGSGVSTLLIAYALERVGGTLFSLEHDADHLRQTRSLLDEHGIGGTSGCCTRP